ncbi:sugar kinase [Saccharophagus degradans]|uniref:sugar kinase n=1 Tax=Saccharophagus degradans TaxID=86304 RepID=UPI0025AF618C|nr:sugar kinase [Saccharophagus degradans]
MRLAAIGECMLELSPANQTDYSLGFGGDTLNTAIYFARLGGEVDFVTALGDDHLSENMIRAWGKENVGTNLVKRTPGALPGLYMIQTDDEGERSFHYWRKNAPARTLIEDWPEVLTSLNAFPAIYLSGITLSLYSPQSRIALFNFLDKYRAQNGQVIFDINYRPASWPDKTEALATFDEMLKRTDTALPSFDDEKLLHGEHSKTECLERYLTAGAKEVVIKDGVNGCLLHTNNQSVLLPVPAKVTPVDTTAAGDSFNGAYLAARLNGASAERAVTQGQACAALVIQHRGAIVPINAFRASDIKNN